MTGETQATQETQAVPAAPAFDVAAMEQRLATAAQAGAARAVENIAARTRADQANRQAAERTQADPVASTVLGNDAVAGALRTVAIKADAGRDAAVFYATTPAAAKYSGAIEGRFNELLSKGIPVDRASLWNLIRGENLPTFIEEEIQNRAAAVKRAEGAAVAQGSRGVPTARVREARDMKPDELVAALENIVF